MSRDLPTLVRPAGSPSRERAGIGDLVGTPDRNQGWDAAEVARLPFEPILR